MMKNWRLLPNTAERMSSSSQTRMLDLAGQRKSGGAIEQAALVAVSTRQNEGGDFHDLITLCGLRVEHAKQDPVYSKKFAGSSSIFRLLCRHDAESCEVK